MVASLGAAKQQMVEIARAVHHNAEVIIFDEPTATLTPEEKHHFFALMRAAARRAACRSSSSATRWRRRCCSPTASPSCATASWWPPAPRANFDRDKIIARHGRPHACRTNSTASATRPALRKPGKQGAVGAGHLDGQHRAQQFLLDLRRPDHRRVRPDRLGPHRDLQDRLRHLQARLPPRRRRSSSTTSRCATRVPREAVRDGIVYVTEDRKIEGFFETMSIAENLFGGLLAAGREKSQHHQHAARCARSPPTGRSSSTSRRSTTMPASSNCPAATSRRW